jgi:hypothetical protein
MQIPVEHILFYPGCPYGFQDGVGGVGDLDLELVVMHTVPKKIDWRSLQFYIGRGRWE